MFRWISVVYRQNSLQYITWIRGSWSHSSFCASASRFLGSSPSRWRLKRTRRGLEQWLLQICSELKRRRKFCWRGIRSWSLIMWPSSIICSLIPRFREKAARGSRSMYTLTSTRTWLRMRYVKKNNKYKQRCDRIVSGWVGWLSGLTMARRG